MDCRSIEIFYNAYKNSIGAIRKLEKKLLDESYSYERWYDILREKSRTIRELYVQNEEMFRITVGELLEHPEELTQELAEMFMTHIDFFLTEGYRDYGVIAPVLEILIPYYEKRQAKDRMLDCYFFMGMTVTEQHRFEEAVQWFSRASKVYGRLSECTEDYRQYRIMCAYYKRFAVYRYCEEITQDKLLAYYRSAYRVWAEEAPEGFLTEKKKKGIISILHVVLACAVGELLKRKEKIQPALAQIVQEEAACSTDCAVFVTYNKILLQRGELDKRAYVDRLREKYRKEAAAHFGGYCYGTWDFLSLFDDELADEDFDWQNLFYVNASYTYVSFLFPELMRYIPDKKLHETLLHETYRYYSGMSYISGDSLIDFLIEKNLADIFPYCTEVETADLLIETVFVHRQICTELHSLMVSRLAELITEDLIQKDTKRAAELIGIPEDMLLERKDALVRFAKRAGLFHDLGKISCSDVINLQARRIQDSEFEIIKRHPSCGAALLEKSPALKVYAPIALGHHKTYDGRGGYPREADNTAFQYRILTDLISICDSIDAATDGLGRNYARAKTFRQVLAELLEGSGTRYNGELVEMISQDEDLIEKIERLTGDERAMVHFQVYKKLIRPDVNFEPADEKYIRGCREEDLAQICRFSGKTEEEQRALLRRSEDLNCLLLDGHGTVFGALFAVRQNAEDVEIVQIAVEKAYRRQGCGSMLLEHFIHMLYPKGCKNLYMPEVTKGHHDKFAWRSGFSRCGRDGWLRRRL